MYEEQAAAAAADTLSRMSTAEISAALGVQVLKLLEIRVGFVLIPAPWPSPPTPMPLPASSPLQPPPLALLPLLPMTTQPHTPPSYPISPSSDPVWIASPPDLTVTQLPNASGISTAPATGLLGPGRPPMMMIIAGLCGACLTCILLVICVVRRRKRLKGSSSPRCIRVRTTSQPSSQTSTTAISTPVVRCGKPALSDTSLNPLRAAKGVSIPEEKLALPLSPCESISRPGKAVPSSVPIQSNVSARPSGAHANLDTLLARRCDANLAVDLDELAVEIYSPRRHSHTLAHFSLVEGNSASPPPPASSQTPVSTITHVDAPWAAPNAEQECQVSLDRRNADDGTKQPLPSRLSSSPADSAAAALMRARLARARLARQQRLPPLAAPTRARDADPEPLRLRNGNEGDARTSTYVLARLPQLSGASSLLDGSPVASKPALETQTSTHGNQANKDAGGMCPNRLADRPTDGTQAQCRPSLGRVSFRRSSRGSRGHCVVTPVEEMPPSYRALVPAAPVSSALCSGVRVRSAPSTHEEGGHSIGTTPPAERSTSEETELVESDHGSDTELEDHSMSDTELDDRSAESESIAAMSVGNAHI